MTRVIRKRIAGRLEKMSVAAAAVVLFQGGLGLCIAAVSLWMSVVLSNQLEKEK